VTEIVLQRAGVVAIVGGPEAAGVSQHVWMDGMDGERRRRSIVEATPLR
jgi:hypothetical protein